MKESINNIKEEGFVKLEDNEYYEIRMQYPLLNMKNAERDCIVRKSVQDMLISAVKKLPDGYKICIYDAWRPLALQQELYESYKNAIIKEFELENKSEQERNAVITQFVSMPSIDPNNPPIHTTGGAVDVTIIDSDGLEIDMGTCFDEFTEKTRTLYFEELLKDSVNSSSTLSSSISREKALAIIKNRRLLYDTMTSVGFTNLSSEWWHYDFGDKLWASITGNITLYSGFFSKEEIFYIE